MDGIHDFYSLLGSSEMHEKFMNFFKKSFRFIAKLRAKYRDPLGLHRLMIYQPPHQSTTPVTTEKMTLVHHYHPKSWFTLEFTFV